MQAIETFIRLYLEYRRKKIIWSLKGCCLYTHRHLSGSWRRCSSGRRSLVWPAQRRARGTVSWQQPTRGRSCPRGRCNRKGWTGRATCKRLHNIKISYIKRVLGMLTYSVNLLKKGLLYPCTCNRQ